jgi:hypothetical protein
MIACSIALAIWTGGLSFLTRREGKRQLAEQEQSEVDGGEVVSKEA